MARTIPAKASSPEATLKLYRKTLGERMNDLRQTRELTVKDICELMAWHKSEYSRKYRGETPFKDFEIVKLRTILSAPKGWPAISMEESMLLEAVGSRAAEVVARLTDIMALLDRHR